MGTPIVYEQPSPLGTALAGVGAYTQEQRRRKELEAELALRTQAEQARQRDAAANLALNTRAQAETERHNVRGEDVTEKTREDAIAERYYQANQVAYQREQDRIEKHWQAVQSLAERRIEFAQRMKLDASKVQAAYAAAQLRYSASMSRIGKMAQDAKANRDTQIEKESMRIQQQIDHDYNTISAGMSRDEYNQIQQSARALGSQIDPTTGLPTNYDPHYTPYGQTGGSGGGGNQQTVYVVPPGYVNPQTGQRQPAAGATGGAPVAAAGPPSFKTYADKALQALQSGMSAQEIMQQLVASNTFRSLSQAEKNRWSAGLARVLGINQPGQ